MKDAREANKLKTGVDLLNTVKKDKAKDKPETKPKG